MSSNSSIDQLEQGDFCELDARGLLCPEPVMLLHNAVRGMDSGDIVRVLATDPSSARDIARFCEFLGHLLLHSKAEEEGDETVLIFWIQRK